MDGETDLLDDCTDLLPLGDTDTDLSETDFVLLPYGEVETVFLWTLIFFPPLGDLEADLLVTETDLDGLLGPTTLFLMLTAAYFIPLPAAFTVFPILVIIPGCGLFDGDPDLDLDCLD